MDLLPRVIEGWRRRNVHRSMNRRMRNITFGNYLLLSCLNIEELLIYIFLVGMDLLGIVAAHVEASK
jgi:hypothetical protein